MRGEGYSRFSRDTRRQVVQEQEGLCDFCGVKPDVIEVHHILPSSMGGLPTRRNAVGLCHEDHKAFDEFALKDGLLYYDVITMKTETMRRAS